MFALDNTELLGDSLGEFQMKPYPMEYTISKFDVSLDIKEDQEGLDCSFEYATSLFTNETVVRMAQHFEQLLRGIVSEPGAKLEELGILTPNEYGEILHVFNQPQDEAASFGTVHCLFEEQAVRTPEHTAVVSGNERMTYRELNERGQ